MTPAPTFTVVLCRPELPENIGFVARSMAAYGLADLRLAGAECPPPDSRAYWTACGGEEVLRRARAFPDLPRALADCQQALAFTRRERDRSQVLFDLRDLQARFQAANPEEGPWPDPSLRTALVFGCESTGLSQEECLTATHLVRIPLASERMSLNLSHAVTVALYALSPRGPEAPSSRDAVTWEESRQALDQVLEVLDRNGFLAKGKKEAARREKARILWQRIRPTRGELDFLCGALKGLAEKTEARP